MVRIRARPTIIARSAVGTTSTVDGEYFTDDAQTAALYTDDAKTTPLSTKD